MDILEVIGDVIFIFIYWGIGLGLLYFFFNKPFPSMLEKIYGLLKEHRDWPWWVNLICGACIFMISITAVHLYYPESLLIWLSLTLLVPFLLMSIRNRLIYIYLTVPIFFLSLCYGILLLFQVDASRDYIGKKFVPNYRVHYTWETQQKEDGVYSEEKVANVKTGNKSTDTFLTSIFPFIYYLAILIIIVISTLLVIQLSRRNHLIASR